MNIPSPTPPAGGTPVFGIDAILAPLLSDLATIKETRERLEKENAAKDAEIETLHMQAAAVMTASMQNTDRTVKDRITRENPYWTQAYQDVCVAVDREMQLRRENAALKAQVERLEEDNGGKTRSIQQYHIEERDLRAQLERFTEIVKNVNGHRGRGDRRMVVPKDDAGRAAYWKARTKQAEAELDKACSSLLDEEAQLATIRENVRAELGAELATVTAELAQERARLDWLLKNHCMTYHSENTFSGGRPWTTPYADRGNIDAARKQEGK